MLKKLISDVRLLIELVQQLIVVLQEIKQQQKSKNEEWLDSADAKMILKKSDRTLYRMRKRNQLEFKFQNGQYYYTRATCLSKGKSSI